MSSGSSGRYQSRLFNFVHQQSRRLTEKWEHTFRHLQVATKWGVEALLTRVYLLFDSIESSGKTLSAKESQPRLQLQPNDNEFESETPPNADIAIVRVLESVQSLPVAETTVTPSKTLGLKIRNWGLPTRKKDLNFPSQSPIPNPQSPIPNPQSPIIGIATNLENRKLVLVCANNEILDILTPQQQAKLEDRIISEVANYWHSWRLAENQQKPNLLPEINQLLTKLAGKNTANMSALTEETPKDLLNTDRMLTLLDTFVAKLEANAIAPVQQRSQEIVRVAQTQLNIFIYGKEQLAARGNITVNPNDLERQKLNFQALIEAALNYFFGVGKSKQLEMSEPHGQPQTKLLNYRRSIFLPKSDRLQNDDLAVDPWLNWDDLFGNSATVTNKIVIPSTSLKPPIAPGLSVPISPPQKLRQQPKAGSGLQQNKKPTRNTTSNITSAKQKAGSISQSKSESSKGKVSQPHRQGTGVEAKPDWIETKAISMGYEKHPLELLLEWLDRAMLWLEKILMNIFYFLQGLLGGNKASKH